MGLVQRIRNEMVIKKGCIREQIYFAWKDLGKLGYHFSLDDVEMKALDIMTKNEYELYQKELELKKSEDSK